MATEISHLTAAPGSSGSNGVAPERSHHKPRKFSMFMKRLANLKSSSAGPRVTGRSASFSAGVPSSKQCDKSSLPSSLSRASSGGHLSFNVHHNFNYNSTGSTDSITSTSDLDGDCEDDARRTVQVPTRPHPALSATTATTSTFSSPTPSMRSLTTTLTTVQSTAPGSMLNANYNPHPTHHHNPYAPPQMYSAPFDSAHGPGALGLLHPVSYNAATAHGVWTDNASIITLASSSKRRRRHSFDTDASVRALAPSSVFGGSRESLPLSVLSGNLDSGLGGRSVAGERGSLYGRSGDTSSLMNSGTGSIMGEMTGTGGPLVSPVPSPSGNRESQQTTGRHSRVSTGWNGDACDGEEAERRSLSARSASIKCPEGDQAEVYSVRDGSSNVGVWHGVPGKPERRATTEERDENGKE